MPQRETKYIYPPTLQWHERLYHRDQLRAARYAVLADAEGFHAVCFALEALGLRLLGTKAELGKYKSKLCELSLDSVVLSEMPQFYPGIFTNFLSLFDLVRIARNDAMHTGVYARHATVAAIELCIGLEDAIMKEQQVARNFVKDFMVKSPLTVQPWQPVAQARQLMLMHSFSYLPVYIDCWKLLSENAMARYMRSDGQWKDLLSATIEHAATNGLDLVDATVVDLDQDVHTLLVEDNGRGAPWLWLVQDAQGNLCGVLSPYELM